LNRNEGGEFAYISCCILIYIQQDATLHSLFYLENALHVSGGTITHHQEPNNCIYGVWYLSHRYCYLPPSWKSWNCSAIVDEMELKFQLIHDSSRQQYWFDNTWRCMYSLWSWWWAEEPPETCRAIYRNKQIAETLHLVGCTLEIRILAMHGHMNGKFESLHITQKIHWKIDAINP